MQIKERVAAASGYSLLAKAVSCAVSVVEVDHVQGRATTNHVRREISISVAYQRPFLVNTFLFDCMFGEMILPHLKNVTGSA